MADDATPPNGAGGEVSAARAVRQVEQALGQLADLKSTLSAGARSMVAAQLSLSVSDFLKDFVNAAPTPMPASSTTPQPVQGPPPAESAKTDFGGPVATDQDLANRQTRSRYYDDVVLLRLLKASAPGQIVIFEDVRKAFIAVGHEQKEPALRTRLSRMRQTGLLEPVALEGQKQRSLAGNYRLTDVGRDEAMRVQKRRMG